LNRKNRGGMRVRGRGRKLASCNGSRYSGAEAPPVASTCCSWVSGGGVMSSLTGSLSHPLRTEPTAMEVKAFPFHFPLAAEEDLGLCKQRDVTPGPVGSVPLDTVQFLFPTKEWDLK